MLQANWNCCQTIIAVPNNGRFAGCEIQQSWLPQTGHFPAPVNVSEADWQNIVRNSGRFVEWHVDLCKSFEYIAFNLVPRFHHAIVLLLSAFALPWLESIGAIGDTMSSNGVEKLLIEDLAVR